MTPGNQSEQVRLPMFFILLFVVSWAGTLPMILASYRVQIPRALGVLQILMLFGPGLVAIFCAWRNGGRPAAKSLLMGLLRWRVNIGWYIAVLAGPALVLSASMFLSNLMGLSSVSFPGLQKAMATFCTTLLVYLFLNTEEIAWRGYALPRLQARFGPMKATAIIGLLWMLFHIPLFLMKGGHPAGYPFWLFAVMILSWTIPFTSVYNGTSGSILLAHILHQSLNAAAEAIPVFPIAAKSLTPILFSAILSAVISGILVWRRLGFKATESTPPAA